MTIAFVYALRTSSCGVGSIHGSEGPSRTFIHVWRKHRTVGNIRTQQPRKHQLQIEPTFRATRVTHWEGDLIGGARNSHIVTLVERRSRFTTLVKVASKDTAAVVAALSRQVRKLPASLRRSLTWDQGLEMAKHQSFTVATNVKVYFCDPHSPWQRGTNENTNRLLRQYLPKRTDLSRYAQSDLDKVALRLNQRPRKTLGFETPASRLRATVAMTH